MAKSAHVRANFPYPESAYHAAVAAGIEAARAWFDTPVKSAGEHKHDARVEYVGGVIDSNEPGCIPFSAAVQGFGDGFDRGIALIVAGGASHV